MAASSDQKQPSFEPATMPMLTVSIEGEDYVRAAPGYSPTKLKKPHVTEKPNLLKNRIYEKVVDGLCADAMHTTALPAVMLTSL